MSIEQTSTGVRKNYGPRFTEDKVPSVTRVAGDVFEHIVEFNYDDLPSASDVDNLVLTLPANSFIESSKLHVKEAFVGGTSVTIGLSETDGTAIDADGIDATIATAALTANAWIVNDGALVGASIGADPAQVVVSAAGTYTAGKAKLVIRYQKAA